MLSSKLTALHVDAEIGVPNPEEKQDAMQQWAATWAEYFRQDETRVDSEIQSLCNRLRALANSLES